MRLLLFRRLRNEYRFFAIRDIGHPMTNAPNSEPPRGTPPSDCTGFNLLRRIDLSNPSASCVMRKARKQLGLSSPTIRPHAAPRRRPPQLLLPTDNEALLSRLRLSLHASTPSPYSYNWREPGPPSSTSSSASSCGLAEPEQDVPDDDDAPSDHMTLHASESEWEAWIDWERIGRGREGPSVPAMEGMRLE